MAHTGPARPANWNSARFGQFQNTLVDRRVPVCSYTASRERHQRPGVGVALGQMRISFYRAHYTRVHRLAAIEDLDVNPLWRDAVARERRFHICHKDSRSTKVNIRFLWDA